MKSIAEFEVEEYKKIIPALDISDIVEDKSQYFNAWHFGWTGGDYVATADLTQCPGEIQLKTSNKLS